MSIFGRIKGLFKRAPAENPPVKSRAKRKNTPTAPVVALPAPLKQYSKSYRKDR